MLTFAAGFGRAHDRTRIRRDHHEPGLFLIGIEALGNVSVAGVLLQFLLVTVGFGAVLITYFGVQEFEPARIPK